MQLYKVLDAEGNHLPDPDGRPMWMKYPPTKEEAIRDGHTAYFTLTPCPVHGPKNQILPLKVFVRSDTYACCVHDQACKDHYDAVVRGEPLSSNEAVEQGKDYYWEPSSFIYCGHSGKTTLKGKCYECQEIRATSPRQLALRAGKKWYMPAPDDPCSQGHIAERRVDNGVCKECERLRKDPADVPFYRMYPDMIISYEDAKTCGLRAFRTGKPCKRGHRGWRYISTRGCITCAGG